MADRLHNWLKIVAACIGSAAILMAYSEFVFLNEGPFHGLLDGGVRHGINHVSALLGFYILMGGTLWVGLFALFRPQNIWRILLTGCIVGWSIEGAMVPAVYEAPPLSYFWTSVIWHGFVDVVFGIAIISILLSPSTSWRKWAVWIVPFSMAWGIWATWLWGSADELNISEFAFSAAVTFGLLVAGYALYFWGRSAMTKIPKWVAYILCVPSAFFFMVHVVYFWVWGLPLVALVALTIWAVGRTGQEDISFEPIDPSKFIAFGLMPIIAIAIYAILYGLSWAPASWIMTSLFIGLGMPAYLFALWRGFKPKA